jgi:uncharacterized damage-inducible protein DinB
MSTTASSIEAADSSVSPKRQFLDAYDREHAITMRVLRAYPQDRLDLRPHPKSKTARELAWMFVLERGLGTLVFNDGFANGPPAGEAPTAPESWDELLAAFERAHAGFADLIRNTPDDEMNARVHFLTAPRTMGEITRLEWVWFLLCDEIHHRGQFSVYLRLADAHVPSIYGPTADEPWM